MPRVISFVRVSTEDQANEGKAGILRQRHDIQVACDRYGLEIARSVELTNVSGTTTFLAPEFQAMLLDLARPDIDGVVVSAQDRLARPDALGDMVVFDPFLRHQKRIWTPGQVIDFSDDHGFMVGGIFALLAGMERKQLLRRIQTAKEEQRKRGRCPGPQITLPRGVNFDHKTGIWSWEKSWVVRVELAYDLLLSGHSLREIANRIGGYSDRGLANVLRNPIWIGIRRYDKQRGEKYPARDGRQVDRRKIPRKAPLAIKIEIEPLISIDIWTRAQEILSGLSEAWNAKRSVLSRFLIGGIGFCKCGQPLYTRGDKRKGKHDIYFCRSRHPRGSGCGSKSLRREIVDGSISKFLGDCLNNQQFLAELVSGAISRLQLSRLGEDHGDLKEASLEKLKRQRSKVIGMATRGVISEEELQAELKRIDGDGKIWDFQARRTILEPNYLSTPDIVQEIVSTLAEFEVLPQAAKRGLLHAVLARVIVSDSGICNVTVKLPKLVVNSRTRTDMDSLRQQA